MKNRGFETDLSALLEVFEGKDWFLRGLKEKFCLKLEKFIKIANLNGIFTILGPKSTRF